MQVDKIEKYIIEAGSDNVSVFGGTYEGGVNCQQVPDELAACIYDILNTGIRVVSFLEIGSASGGTAFLINHFFKPEKVVLIDNNLHWKAPLRSTVLEGIEREEIIGNSTSDYVIKEALGHAPYDIVIIDGDHSYEGVKADVENYSPMLSVGGFLLFHDTDLDQWGVGAVIKELKQDKHLRFLNEYKSKKRTPLGLAVFQREI